MAEQSLQEFVRDRGAALSRFAYLLTCDHHLAQDLVQTALARALPRWHRIAGDRPEAYLRRVMCNERISLWRRRRRRVAEVSLDRMPDGLLPEPADPAAAHHTELRLVVRDALAQLGRRDRALIVLRYFEDQSVQDTARILGMTAGTVKSATHRALARLRHIPPELSEPPDPPGTTGAGDHTSDGSFQEVAP